MGGFLYIMSNPSFERQLVKIGKSDRDPTEFRAAELYSTGVPKPFKVEWYGFVDDHHRLERDVHKALKSVRENASREFFSILVPSAITVIKRCSRNTIVFEKNFYNHDEASIMLNEQRAERRFIFYSEGSYNATDTGASNDVEGENIDAVLQKYSSKIDEKPICIITPLSDENIFIQFSLEKTKIHSEFVGQKYLECSEDIKLELAKELEKMGWKPPDQNPLKSGGNFFRSFDQSNFAQEAARVTLESLNIALNKFEIFPEKAICIYQIFR